MSLPRFAVFGQPVAHSLSPRIHAAFASQFGIALDYQAIDTPADDLADALRRFADAGGVGANITVPHKSEAADLCRNLSHRARKAGVVNTLTRRDDGWDGDNTDGVGFVRDLQQRHGIELHDRRVLLIGAGGAAHGVAPAMLNTDIEQLVIANRTRARAYDLIDRLDTSPRLRACILEELPTMGSFDLVIHATSAGHGDQTLDLPDSLVGTDSACVDLNYGRAALPFMAWAHRLGCSRVHDGLGMLVEQAAEAFELWHGQRPDTDPVYAQLRLASPPRN